MWLPRPVWEDLPDRMKGPEGRRHTEEAMGYVLFLVIAFVMLGAERIVARWHPHEARHEPPRVS
jgi:hypothetical protein